MTTAPIAFLSDIHGNTPALRAVLADIEAQQCKLAFVLGDIINGMDPHGCAALLRAWSESADIHLNCIKGNAEAYLTTPDRDALPMQEIEWNRGVSLLIQWIEDRLSASDLDWIASLPDTLRWNDALLVHDSPLDRRAMVENGKQLNLPEKYYEWFFHGRGLVPETTEAEWDALWREMATQGYSRVFCGHTHVPFTKMNGKYKVYNVGSVGMPLDGDPRPSWAMLAEINGQPAAAFRRVDYDIDLALQLVDKTLDYPSFQDEASRAAYKQRLITGRFHKHTHTS